MSPQQSCINSSTNRTEMGSTVGSVFEQNPRIPHTRVRDGTSLRIPLRGSKLCDDLYQQSEPVRRVSV